MIVNTAINCSLKRSFKLQSAKCKVQSAKLRKNLRAQTSEMPGNRNRFLSVPLTRSGREGFSGEWCSAQRIYNLHDCRWQSYHNVWLENGVPSNGISAVSKVYHGQCLPWADFFGYFLARRQESTPPEAAMLRIRQCLLQYRNFMLPDRPGGRSLHI